MQCVGEMKKKKNKNKKENKKVRIIIGAQIKNWGSCQLDGGKKNSQKSLLSCIIIELQLIGEGQIFPSRLTSEMKAKEGRKLIWH